MQQTTLHYHRGTGWSAALPAALDSERTLVLAFAGPAFGADPRPFADIAAALPRSLLLGCSTAGEMAAGRVEDDSVSVAVLRFDHARLRRAGSAIGSACDAASGAVAAGAVIAAQLAAPDLRWVFVLSDGLRVNGSRLVEALAAGLPAGVTISGGLAGDGSDFRDTWVLGGDGGGDGGEHGASPRAGHVVAVGVYGDRLRIGHGCDGGWSGFGPERRITHADGNVLYALDDKPALQLYKDYLGDRAAGLPASALLFPLMVHGDGADADPLVRTILAVDEASQSMTFAGDLPQGGHARLMRAGPERLIASAGRAGQQAVAGMDGAAAQLLLSVSCVGRRLVLGERCEEEVEAVAALADDGAGHFGFYSYGEIGPAALGHVSRLHNQTMTVTAIGEV